MKLNVVSPIKLGTSEIINNSKILPSAADPKILNLVPIINPSLHWIPGIYMLDHPFCPNIVKIGSSTNIGRRIRDSCYTTMFPEDKMPKLLGYFRVEGYDTIEEVVFLERAIHRNLNIRRISPNRELFMNVTPLDVSMIIRSYALTISQDRTPVPSKSDQNCQIDHVEMRNPVEHVYSVNLIPLNHQTAIIDSLKNYFEPTSHHSKRGKLILPCGYGKMYISLFFLRDIAQESKVVIILVPSLILSGQFYEVSMTILSNWTITQYDGENKNIILSERIKNLVICTYQSAYKLIPLIPMEKVSYIIYDEAHRTCVASKRIDEYSLFRDTIDLFPTANKLFMTATEKIVTCVEDITVPTIVDTNEKDEESLGETLTTGDIYFSMDNPQIYGETIYHRNFDQAVEEGTISDYRLAVCVQDDNPVAVIRTGFTELGLCHLLTYSNTCENARALCTALQSCVLLQSLNIEAYYLDGTYKENERKDVLRRFEQSRCGILCSVKVLQEGISLPYVDSIYFVEPRCSEIDIVQMVGRALRVHKDKTLATILLPRTMLKYGQILKTLVIMDNRLKTDTGIKRRLIELSGTITHGTNGGVVIGSMLNNVKLQLLKRGEGLWNYKYNLCLEWEQLNPEKIIPGELNFKDINIGVWLANQKSIYKNQLKGQKHGRNIFLADDQIGILNSLFTWREYVKIIEIYGGNKWEMKFSACIQWEREHPDTSISCSESYQGINIGIWLDSCKRSWFKHKNGKYVGRYAPLSLEQNNKLNMLFSWRTRVEKFEQGDPWNVYYGLCVEWEKEHHNNVISSTQEYNNVKIGSWLNKRKGIWMKQRTGVPYKNRKSISEDQIKMLSELYTWKVWISEINLHKRKGDWMGKFQVCLEWEQLNYGKTIVQSLTFKDINIGYWLNTQKNIYSKQLMGDVYIGSKLLSQEQINLLDQLYTWRKWLISRYPNLPQLREISFIDATTGPIHKMSLNIIKSK